MSVRPQIEVPMLANQIFAEGMVPLFRDQLEAGGLVEAAGGGEHVVGPERQHPGERALR